MRVVDAGVEDSDDDARPSTPNLCGRLAPIYGTVSGELLW